MNTRSYRLQLSLATCLGLDGRFRRRRERLSKGVVKAQPDQVSATANVEVAARPLPIFASDAQSRSPYPTLRLRGDETGGPPRTRMRI